jgi:hypothetical protein
MKKNLVSHIRMGAMLALCMLPTLLAAAEISITPPPGKAAVVVYRLSRVKGVLLQHKTPDRIAFDEQWISSLSPGEHFVFYAWPGAHRIESALWSERRAEGDSRPGTLRLDVKAGETYYVTAGPVKPTVISTESSQDVAVMLMDQESALKDLAESKPVDWAKDLVEGTLAEVRALDLQAGGTSVECGPAEWSPDVDSVKTSVFKRSSFLHGTVHVRDDALVLKLVSPPGETSPVGVTIPFADIAAVEIKNKVLKRIVLITRKNGRVDSFSVTTEGGGRVDRDRTKACGDRLAGKLGT